MLKKTLITASILTLMGGGIYYGAGSIINPFATQMIRQNGFPEARISSISLIPSGLMIDKISLDGDDFSTVENIVLSFDWIDFILRKKINALEIKDITITAELDEANHFKMAGWDATLPRSESSSALIPIHSILLQGLTIDLDTPHGDIRLQGKVSLKTPTPNEQVIEYAVWGQQHQLSFDAKGSGKISAQGDFSFLTLLNEGRINLPNIEISRASGDLKVAKIAADTTPHVTGKLLAGKINTLGALLQNVEIVLDTDKIDSLSFKTSPAGFKDIQIEGKWITSPQNFLELSINSLKTIDLITVLFPDKIQDYKPWIGNSNPLFLHIKSPLTSLQEDDKMAEFILSLGGKNSEMSLEAEGKINYQTKTAQSSLRFDKLNMHIAGGQVIASPFTFSKNETGIDEFPVSLTIQSVDMSKIAKLADIDGLRVTGRLSGNLPMTYSDKGLVFGDGQLTSDSDGLFSYQPDTFPPSFQGDDERMQIVREALKNFKFSKLRFDMSGELDKKMKTTLTAEGTNLELSEQPIKLNLNLDGDLGAVIKQTLQSTGIQDRIPSR
jgi:Dicarboxylate transport